MLDWNSLIPSAADVAPSKSTNDAPKTGELPINWGTNLPLLGNIKHSDTNGFGKRSPVSPVSPVQKQGTDSEQCAGGVGRDETNCARKLIFMALGDLRMCELCGNLTAASRCAAAARREIVASRNYEPIRDLPRRCEAYMPPADDPDQRPGFQRWPGLVR